MPASPEPYGPPQDLPHSRAESTTQAQAGPTLNDHEVVLALLKVLSTSSSSSQELVSVVIRFLQDWSGCQAVGIRLRDGEDFPYAEARGFPAEFIEMENSLCQRDSAGQVVRERQGNPVLDCICGVILSGRFDPSKPFFTEGGSYWTNSTSQLLASTTVKEQPARTRNRCNAEGYESVALVPLRTGATIYGLMQFNDPRPGRFNRAMIGVLERLGECVAMALAARRAEESARVSEANLRCTLEATDESVLLIDREGRVLLANRVTAQRMGTTLERIVGTCAYSWLPPDCAERRRRHMEEAVRTARPMRFLDERFGRWIESSIYPVCDAEGKVARLAIYGRDVTEQRQAEAALQESEQRWQFALEGAGDGVWDWDIPSGKVFFSSRWKSMLGYADDEIGSSLQEWDSRVHPEDKADVYREIQKHLSGQAAMYVSEHRVRCKDGSWKWILDRGQVVSRTADGQPGRMIGTHADLTRQKAAEQETATLQAQLMQAQKMEAIGRLAAGIAHDINNQLTVVRGYSDLLLAGRSPNDPLFGPLSEIRNASRRTQSTTAHLLAYSRKQMLRPEVTDLNQFLRELLGPAGKMSGEDIHLVLEEQAGLPLVRIDRPGLHQAMMNLIVNARDAMPEGGTLKLRTSSRLLNSEEAEQFHEAVAGPWVVLEVADTGTGMEPAVLQHIFEPFFTTKDVGRGTGLGLPMVHGFVRQSGGCITVRTCAGEGSVFTIALPPAAPGRQASDSVSADPGVSPRGPLETVLVIEDEEPVRNLVEVALRQAGYRVFSAPGPEEALRLARTMPAPDLLVSDVIMPGMKGTELVHSLHVLHPEARVLYITGYAGNRTRGMNNCLIKPFSIHDLLNLVRKTLDEKSDRMK